MKIARVFPRKTTASPIDELSFFTVPMAKQIMPEFDEVHISVTFTYDIPVAEWLYHQWEYIGVPVKIGGPAFNEPGGEFIPGMYLKKGYTITSRGCPNRCWFCAVPKREGYKLKELEIKDGWNILDDNLLACSEKHIRDVFDMLSKQEKNPVFSGGLEAKLLKKWQAEELYRLKPRSMYFAYDTPDDYEPLLNAGELMRNAGFKKNNHSMACYVLIGYQKDTFENAEKRLQETIRAGFFPYAMLYKDKNGTEDKNWRKFQREWCRPTIVASKIKEISNECRK